jgi:hypothetical protein
VRPGERGDGFGIVPDRLCVLSVCVIGSHFPGSYTGTVLTVARIMRRRRGVKG